MLKRFKTPDDKKIYGFGVEILKDPFEFLLSIKTRSIEDQLQQMALKDTEVVDYIVLPLYSIRNNKVEERSGLNQWNAGGRERNKNEVYISIPSWSYRCKKRFFKYNTEDNKTGSFDVKLPNGDTKEQLDIIGIDSVKLSKMKDGFYSLDFLKTGSFEEFEEEFRR